MKRTLLISLTLLSFGILTMNVFGLMIPFSKERIAAAGKHCVHGYDGNMGQVGIYYTGDTSALNGAIRSLAKPHEDSHDSYTDKVIILHPGSMVVPKYLDPKEKTAADWLVTSWLGDHGSHTDWHLQIDIWLGGQIKLDELRIPEGFTVKSGREIEDFVEKHQNKKPDQKHSQ